MPAVFVEVDGVVVVIASTDPPPVSDRADAAAAVAPGAAPSSSSSVDGRRDDILTLHGGRGCHTTNDRRRTTQRATPSFPPGGVMSTVKIERRKESDRRGIPFSIVETTSIVCRLGRGNRAPDGDGMPSSRRRMIDRPDRGGGYAVVVFLSLSPVFKKRRAPSRPSHSFLRRSHREGRLLGRMAHASIAPLLAMI